jgi:hypothetical protein
MGDADVPVPGRSPSQARAERPGDFKASAPRLSSRWLQASGPGSSERQRADRDRTLIRHRHPSSAGSTSLSGRPDFSFCERVLRMPRAPRRAPGAVAQLGERCVRNAEVEGSTPFRSTGKALFATPADKAFSLDLQGFSPSDFTSSARRSNRASTLRAACSSRQPVATSRTIPSPSRYLAVNVAASMMIRSAPSFPAVSGSVRVFPFASFQRANRIPLRVKNVRPGRQRLGVGFAEHGAHHNSPL